MNKILVIPDIHGRSFWKDAVEKYADECDLIIFNATDNIETGHLLCNIPFADKELFEGEKLQVIYDEYLKMVRNSFSLTLVL